MLARNSSVYARLPIRVDHYEGETLGSLFSRACSRNLLRPNQLLAHIGLGTKDPVHLANRSDLDHEALASLLGVEPDTIKKAILSPLDGTLTSAYLMGFNQSWSKRIFCDRTRLLLGHDADELHTRITWSTRGVNWCDQSLKFLAERCPACAAPFSSFTVYSAPWCQACEKDLTCHEAPEIPLELHEGAKLVAALVSDDQSARDSVRPVLPEEWREFCTTSVFLVINLIADWVGQIDDFWSSNEKQFRDSADLNLANLVRHTKAFAILLEGAEPLERVLEDFPAPARPRALKNVVGPLRSFFEPRLDHDPAVIYLRSVIADLVDKTSPPSIGVSGNTVHAIKQQERLRAREAGKKFGVHNRALSRLFERGDCIISRSDGPKGWALFDERKLSEAVDHWRHSVTYSKCAAFLGVPSIVVSALVAEGSLQSETHNDACLLAGEPIIKQASVDALVQAARQLPSNTSLRSRPLIQALAGIPEPGLWAELISSITAGDHEGYFGASAEHALAEIHVSESFCPIAHAGSRVGDFDDHMVTLSDASTLIGWSYPVFWNITRALKINERDYNSRRIRLSFIKWISSKYISSTEVSSLLGIHPRSLRFHLQKHAIMPSLSTENAAFYERSEFEQFMEETSHLYPAQAPGGSGAKTEL